MSNKSTENSLTSISYQDLLIFGNTTTPSSPAPSRDITRNLLTKIGQAFGSSSSSLGIILVTDVPNFATLRSCLLPLAQQLATLPPKDLEEMTVEESGYQVGWSHGKERVEGDRFDTGKGSFYANPLTDTPMEHILDRDFGVDGLEANISVDSHCTTSEDRRTNPTMEEYLRVAETNPAFYAPNVWPRRQLPRFETEVKEMGRLIRDVGQLVARLCDAYVAERCPKFTPGKLERVITDSLCCKSRLLHYFPQDEEDPIAPQTDDGTGAGDKDTDFSTWCGWHSDHGSLTGLVPAIYLSPTGTPVECPDPSAGLYIKSRQGQLVHARLPPNALAFQIGETTQIHTGGILQATPHAVRACRGGSMSGISRESFAVFMEPEFYGDLDIPLSMTIEDAQKKEVQAFLPASVRTLRSRWKQGMNFGEFSNATFAAFH